MAEFCSLCHARAPKLFPSEIDVRGIAKKLKPGYSQSVMCEGCALMTIYKDEAGKLYLGYYIRGETQWRDYELDLV